jgi:hypothetical protein
MKVVYTGTHRPGWLRTSAPCLPLPPSAVTRHVSLPNHPWHGGLRLPLDAGRCSTSLDLDAKNAPGRRPELPLPAGVCRTCWPKGFRCPAPPFTPSCRVLPEDSRPCRTDLPRAFVGNSDGPPLLPCPHLAFARFISLQGHTHPLQRITRAAKNCKEISTSPARKCADPRADHFPAVRRGRCNKKKGISPGNYPCPRAAFPSRLATLPNFFLLG